MIGPMMAGVGTVVSSLSRRNQPRAGWGKSASRTQTTPSMSHQPVDSSHQTTRPPRWLGGAILILLAACASPSPTPTTSTLEGTILLTDARAWDSAHLDGPCEGQGGYDDIRGGADVVVRNEAGDIIATSSLQTGTLVTRTECEFAFTVGAVPVAEFYEVEVSHRGGLTYSAAEMEQMGWRVALTLGD